MLFFTDPVRTPDAEEVARRLPPGSGVVFRAFGASDAEARGRRLATIARERKLVLLVGADASLALTIGAAGVHLPERLARRAGPLKRTRPAWTVTTAAHSLLGARRAAAAGADACVVSPVFPSRSPSAGAPIGPLRLAAIVRSAGLPVYALGGVDDETARRLEDVGLVGLAAIDGLRT